MLNTVDMNWVDSLTLCGVFSPQLEKQLGPRASAGPTTLAALKRLVRLGHFAVAWQPQFARLVPGSNRFRRPFQSVSRSNNFILFTIRFYY